MTNPTTPFNWQMPTASDLVTDLPADFETFGQAVATSMADLLGGTTGQILAKNSNTDMDFVWTSPNPGDITAVTAGTGISGGGTSGDVTITNSMATAIDAKGDLIGGTGADTFARLAVGTNGQVLTADSAAATGLAWATPSIPSNLFYAGKNKIINGDFGIWQRGTSFNVGGSWIYTTDRFQSYMVSGTSTASRQAFTPGTAPVAGYEGIFFIRHTAPASGGVLHFRQSIENVQTFAGQTVTLSFWAKASANRTLNARFGQYFGSGGSADVNTSNVSHSITTSWTRFTQTVAIPSISGKTIGANSLVEPYFTTATNFTSSETLDIWGVQVEAGSTATEFVTASGNSPQAELAMCQRYYWRKTSTSEGRFAFGSAVDSTTGWVTIRNPVPMRANPSSVEFSGVTVSDAVSYTLSVTAMANSNPTPMDTFISYTCASGQSARYPSHFNFVNGSGGHFGVNAEL